MAHRRLVLRERITAIVGSSILLVLIGMSYYYSIQSGLSGLRYIPSESSPDFTAQNVTLTDFNEKGVATERLVASSMEHFSDEGMRALDARFMTLNPDRAQMTARADEAWSDDGLETIELSGNVFLRQLPFAEDPEVTFTTEYLRGWLDTHRFETDRPVFMTRGNDSSEARRGMVYDNVARTVELRERVHTVLHPQNFQQSTANSGQ